MRLYIIIYITLYINLLLNQKEYLMKIITIEEIEKSDWSKFVFNHPKGNVFQTPEMYEVYAKTKKYEPIFLAIIHNNNIQALLLAHIIKEFNRDFGSISSRSIIQSGPIFNENKVGLEALKLLLTEYDRIVKKRALYTEIRNMFDVSEFNHIFFESGFLYKEMLNFLIDLTKGRDLVWKDIHKTMRKNIKRAERKEIQIEEITNKGQISKFYTSLLEVYESARIPLADISFFKQIFKILVPKKFARFHLAKYNGEYIGGRLSYFFNKIIFAAYVGTSFNYRKLNVNALLNWRVIEWGLENKFETFDFGGGGKPGDLEGIRSFKRQFGGKLIELGRLEKVHKPLLKFISKKGFKLYRKFGIG